MAELDGYQMVLGIDFLKSNNVAIVPYLGGTIIATGNEFDLWLIHMHVKIVV